jgi:hypothetical protein
MLDKEKQAVIKAIGELGRRVTAADVATKTGLPLLTVQQKLNQVALEVGGHMQVAGSGDIAYSFAPGFSNTYLAKGVAAALLLVGAKLMQVLFYLLRISFGIALILSLITIVVLLVLLAIVMSRGMGGDRDDRGGDFFGDFNFGGGGFHFSFWDWMILRDLLWWNSMSYSGPVRYQYNQPTIRPRKRSNFLLNCFSFLFGDGDPNEGLDEKRWQIIAQVIKNHNNVVTAEQLAPYTGADPKNEDAVLPVLVRFNGKPEVTSSGHIVYLFESLQSTAADQAFTPPEYLHEFNWKFTNVPEGELLPVYIVAGLNLFGAWTLWNWIQRIPAELARHNAAIGATAPPIAFTHSLVPLVTGLCIYGSLFVAVPIVRVAINHLRNNRINARNTQRLRYAKLLERPSEELTAKLKEARVLGLSDRKVRKEDVIYTTEKDALDQSDELSDKFTELEKKGSPGSSAEAPKPAEKEPEGDASDAGGKINLRQYEEFDASP